MDMGVELPQQTLISQGRKTDRTNLEDSEGALLGCEPRYAGRRVGPEPSSALQLFSRTFYLHLLETARQERPAAGCGGREGVWGGLERRCHVVSNDFPSKGLKLSLI